MRRLAMLTAIILSLGGCVSLVNQGTSQSVRVVSQERSVGRAIDDNVIFTQIKHLYFKHDVDELLTHVGVEVNEGRVLLTGDVVKPETAIEAVRLAWLVDGVTEVINELQVKDKSGLKDWARDAWISTQIESRLLLARDIRSVNYSVETVNAVVYIFGIAQDQTELDKAAYIARTTKYVQQVVSHVRLKTDTHRQ